MIIIKAGDGNISLNINANDFEQYQTNNCLWNDFYFIFTVFNKFNIQFPIKNKILIIMRLKYLYYDNHGKEKFPLWKTIQLNK